MNNLEGEIPKSFGKLRALTGINLSHNQIKGTVFLGIFSQISQLEVLDLSYNQLNGKIPKDLASLDSLNTLNLSYNRLQGSILVQNNFYSKFDASNFINNPGLCGSPLPSCNPNISGIGDHPQGNTISNKLSQQLNEVRIWLTEFVSPWAFLIGYLISLAFGIFLVYHVTSQKSDAFASYR
jgi:Leucine-rich repeat (LRR) protein